MITDRERKLIDALDGIREMLANNCIDTAYDLALATVTAAKTQEADTPLSPPYLLPRGDSYCTCTDYVPFRSSALSRCSRCNGWRTGITGGK